MKITKQEIGLICHIEIDVGISFWQAIKLRIAGKAYMPIAEQIAERIKSELKAKEQTHD